MTPPAIKRDAGDLVALLLERLDRFEKSLSDMGATLARFEVLEQQAHAAIAQAQMRTDRLENRLQVLEALSNKAEGAARGVAWFSKAVWVALAAGVGAVGHYLAAK